MNRAFAKAFALWEAGVRAHPDKYMTAEETAAADALPLSEQRAEYFEGLLATLAIVEDDR